MKKKRAAVDVEGTLADIHKSFVELYNRLYDKNFTIEDINDWDFRKSRIGTNLLEFTILTRKLWQDWEAIPPTEDRLGEKMREIEKRGYEIDIVTARMDSAKEIKKWLKYNDIPYTNFYYMLNYMSPKSHMVSTNGYKMVIDDNPNLAKHLENKPDILVFLMDRPWNRNNYTVKTKNVYRVKNFDEIIEILDELYPTP